ncbi:MAG: glutamate--cysteine ligase [Gammaproteobacteria bacterium]|nr:glutamate--cysteine ligase [Gammaproteobacteria bacterium]MDH5692244.1 glutamate--cysteine ligase [Gammaproteobacteria bacterium]
MNKPTDFGSSVPNLTTALTGPLLELETHFLEHQADIEIWLRQQWRKTPASFYASVDLRNAGFKLAPVDTNLFPAGFNNLNSQFMPLCIQAVQSVMERICPEACGVLIIPENHTRNLFYLESLATLQDIIRNAGYKARIGSLIPDLEGPQEIELPSGKRIILEPVKREGDKIFVEGFSPCTVLLNNDLSAGRPAILENIEQTVIPPLDLGWANRLKSMHFTEYQQVANEFAKKIDIDPWLIDPVFHKCGEINFMKREGEECVAKGVEETLKRVQKKYDEYGVDKRPFAIVKADAGTYGMGVMTVHEPDEIFELNRKQRTRMSSAKEGSAITRVIVQEGVYSFETWGADKAVAEPVVYMIDHFVVGGFYRVHTGRGVNENLNAPGMHFEPLAFAECLNSPDNNLKPDAAPNRFYAYGVIARLALLAAAREISNR